MGLILGLGSARARRLEFASARHAGVGLSSLLCVAIAEALVPVLTVWLLSTPAILWLTRVMGRADRLAVMQAAFFVIWCASIAYLLGTFAGVIAARERHLFRYFKAR